MLARDRELRDPEQVVLGDEERRAHHGVTVHGDDEMLGREAGAAEPLGRPVLVGQPRLPLPLGERVVDHAVHGAVVLPGTKERSAYPPPPPDRRPRIRGVAAARTAPRAAR